MIIIQFAKYKGQRRRLLGVKPSAAAVYWFLKASGEVAYDNQEELAKRVGISYGTFKDGLKELRKSGLLERDKKHIRLCLNHNEAAE